MAIEIQEWPKVTVWREEKGIPKRWHSESRCLNGPGYDDAPDPCRDLSKAFSGSDSGSLEMEKDRTEVGLVFSASFLPSLPSLKLCPFTSWQEEPAAVSGLSTQGYSGSGPIVV